MGRDVRAFTLVILGIVCGLIRGGACRGSSCAVAAPMINSITAGPGILATPDPIPDTGTIEIAPAGVLPTQMSAFPIVKAGFSTNLVVPDSTITTVLFDTEIDDTDNMHDDAINITRFTCMTAATYRIAANIGWFSSQTTSTWMRFLVSGTTENVRHEQNGQAAIRTQHVSVTHQLCVGDYVELEVVQSSGGNESVQMFHSTVSMELIP